MADKTKEKETVPVATTTEDKLILLLQDKFREYYQDGSLKIKTINSLELDSNTSILTRHTETEEQADSLVGLYPIQVTFERNNSIHTLDVVVKAKAMDTFVIEMVNQVAASGHPKMASEYEKYKHTMDFSRCHIKEVAIYREQDARFKRHVPVIYGSHIDEEKKQFIIIQEYLDDQSNILKDTANDTSVWKREHILTVIEGLSQLNALGYRKEAVFLKKPWMTNVPTLARMKERKTLWQSFVLHAKTDFDWFTEEDAQVRYRIIDGLEKWWAELETMPKTLVHNDFNPRNIVLKKIADEQYRLCVYDWELATINVPQYDLAEFLVFVLQPDTVDAEQLLFYVETHRKAFEEATGEQQDVVLWQKGFRYSLWHYAIVRWAMYLMFNSLDSFPYAQRNHMTLNRMIKIMNGL